MITMVLIAAAASAMQPLKPARLLNEFITVADLPAGWSRGEWLGASNFTYLRMTIDPGGKPFKCEVATSFALPKRIDACALALNRAQFDPALDQDQRPAFGVTYVWFGRSDKKWMSPFDPHPASPDIFIPVNSLPKDAPGNGVGITLAADVDPQGRVKSCLAEPGPYTDLLGKLACEQVSAGTIPPAHDAYGSPTRSIQVYVAQFYKKPRR